MINSEALKENIKHEIEASKKSGDDSFRCTYQLAEVIIEYIDQEISSHKNHSQSIFRFTVINPEYDNYRGFMVVSDSIPHALEEIYKFICYRDGELVRDIPYVLRSSNMEIERLGEFIPNKKLDSNILFTDFYNA